MPQCQLQTDFLPDLLLLKSRKRTTKAGELRAPKKPKVLTVVRAAAVADTRKVGGVGVEEGESE